MCSLAARGVVHLEDAELQVGQRPASAHDVERPLDLLLARVDQRHQCIVGEAVPPRRFAQRLDDRLGTRRAGPRRLDRRLAPPGQTNAPEQRFARDDPGARQLMVEGQQRQQAAPRRLGREQGSEKTVAVGFAYRIEREAVRGVGGSVRRIKTHLRPLNARECEITMARLGIR